MREALRCLQAEGLLEESPSRGLQVAVPTAEEIEQIYEIRAELEPLAVRLFVERASNEEVDELASIIEEMGPRGYPTKEVLDHFERVLLRGCRNPILEEVLGGLYSRTHALRRVSASTAGRMSVAKQDYADLAEAIRRRSALDAVSAARRHVTAATESAKVAMGLLVQDPGAAFSQGSSGFGFAARLPYRPTWCPTPRLAATKGPANSRFGHLTAGTRSKIDSARLLRAQKEVR
jgi:DNA-binding GntR family transcriptional regulator